MSSEIFVNIFEDGLFAAIAAIGFSSISNTPRRAYAVCALIAAAGHAVRYVLMAPDIAGMHIVMASTLAAMVVGVLGVLLAPLIKCPAEVCLFPALLPMIPGMYAYRTVQALISCMLHTGETAFDHYLSLFAQNGLTCTFIMLGMVLGANIPVFVLKKISFQATR